MKPNKQVLLSSNELWDYSENVLQTYDGYFLAIRPEIELIPSIETIEDCIVLADLLIHIYEAAFWEITTSDISLIAKLKHKFRETEIYDSVPAELDFF